MGICSRRHFLLTICTLQLLTTIERQVFDFLGYMWVPILVNFFNIIFVILGFFGAFQYRTKYILVYCGWNTLWLGWNIFCICFYLDVGILKKKSDLLNFGTGSFSWWYANGPGCKAEADTADPEYLRPHRPNVTDCVLDYEVIEVLHASTQCLLAFMAIVGGICLSRVYLEEDDSFDYLGGDDFGLAGHTPLHPLYVSYSALPSAYSQSNPNYQSYPRGTTGSNNSSSVYRDTTLPKHSVTDTMRAASTRNPDCDYSNPLDHLHRPTGDYDSLEHAVKTRLDKDRLYQSTRSYSPIVSPVMRRARTSQASKQNRNSYRPRVFTDFVREQPLRSFYSDPRLAITLKDKKPAENGKFRESRPLSLCATQL